MSDLALLGGTKAKPTPYNLPNRYGEEEVRHLTEAIQHGHLMYTSGTKVHEFEEGIQQKFGSNHCVMTTSGTAALHIALVAVGVAEGDEVITTAMSDMGTTACILAQHAIPVFADITSDSVALDPQDVERRITEKTTAIVVVHMAGIPADMDTFLRIGEKHGVAIVEDCAQCHLGRWKGRACGTLGDVGAFSMNESKHMSTGDGGFVITDDPGIARIARLSTDKTYQRDRPSKRGCDPIPFQAVNYRPTCLQSAVAVAQLGKLDWTVSRRAEIVSRYYENLGDLPHLAFPKLHEGAVPAWWPVPVRYTAGEPDRDVMLTALQAEGLAVGKGMSPPGNMLHTELISNKRFYPLTDRVPMFWRDTVYDPDSCPNTDELHRRVLRLPVDQRYTDEDISQTIEGIRKVWKHYFGVQGGRE